MIEYGIDLAGRTTIGTSVVYIENKLIKVEDTYHSFKSPKTKQMEIKRDIWPREKLAEIIRDFPTVIDCPHGNLITIMAFQDPNIKIKPEWIIPDQQYRYCEYLSIKFCNVKNKLDIYNPEPKRKRKPPRPYPILDPGAILPANRIVNAGTIFQIYTIRGEPLIELFQNRKLGQGGGETVPTIVQGLFAIFLQEQGYPEWQDAAQKIKFCPGGDAASVDERYTVNSEQFYVDRRAKIIDLLCKYQSFDFVDAESRRLCAESDDTFEAMMCAVTAYYQKIGEFKLFGKSPYDIYEGRLVLPIFKPL